MSGLEICHYTPRQAESGLWPFSGKYDDDPWVVFHGTSNHVELEIEGKGLIWKNSSYSQQDVERVVNIFQQLHWTGTTTAGFGVLNIFTKNDFLRGGGQKKPVYLAESSQRALLYSTSDFVGGETARALRYAFADLDQYLACEDLRDNAAREAWRRIRDMHRLQLPAS